MTMLKEVVHPFDVPTAEPSHLPPLSAGFEQALEDAKHLLRFAAETGAHVNPDVRNSILAASAVPRKEWTPQTIASLLDALTKLTVQLHPVTAESLREYGKQGGTVNGYWKIAALLALVIIPFSVASFVSSALSDAIRKDIAAANALAVKLTAQLQPGTDAAVDQATQRAGVPVADIVTELQQFAATIRSIDGHARQLKSVLLVFAPEDPFAGIRRRAEDIHDTFELPPDVLTDLSGATTARIQVFQKVRYFAQTGVDDVSLFYGALSTCVLPLLYALLGTCAYLLRSFEDQMRTRTFIRSSANSARFLIAGIGGAVVGLFNNFTVSQGASIPPLALAFLVGYAVDVFFSFLEGLLQSFTKAKPAPAGGGASGR